MKRWWEAPEWGKAKAMEYPDLRGGPMRRVGTIVTYEPGRGHVSTPIRVYVGSISVCRI